MIPYVKEIVQQFAEFDDSDSTAATPAAEHLFKVNPHPSPNDKRPYSTTSSPSVSFAETSQAGYRYCCGTFTTRVKGPDEDDWKAFV
jgi:hypothetical protein